MFKRLMTGVALAALLSTTAFAAVQKFDSCSKDGVQAELTADVADGDMAKRVQKAFDYAAHQLAFEDLVGSEGYQLFVSQLSDEDYDDISVAGAPVSVGRCK